MTLIVLCSRFVLALLALLLTLPAAWGQHGPGYTPPPGNCNTGCTITPSTPVASLTTSGAQDAAGTLLTFSNPAGAVPGQPASGTNIPANDYLLAVSTATAPVTLTTPIAVLSGATAIPVSSITGLAPLMRVNDTTTTNAVTTNTYVTSLLGGTATSGNLTTSGTVAAGVSTIPVTSGGTGCNQDDLIFDTTASTAIPVNSSVMSSTATSIIMSNAVTSPGVGSGDTIVCYPAVQLSLATTNATVTADSVTFTPGAILASASTGIVPTSTTISLGPLATTIGASGLATIGAGGIGAQGLQFNGANFLTAFGNSENSAAGGPGTDVVLGTGAGAALPPIDYDTVAIGWHALNLSGAGGGVTESTAVGYNSQSHITSGNYNTTLGISTLGTCSACTHTIAIGTDAVRNEIVGDHDIAIGINALKDGNDSTSTAIGHGALDGSGSVSFGTDNIAIGLNAAGGAQRTTANKLTCVGDQSCGYNSVTTATSDSALGFNALQKVSTGINIVAIGATAGSSITTQSADTLVGSGAGAKLTSGTGRNTLIGASVGGSTLTTGQDNIIIGTSSQADTASGSTNDTLLIQGNGTTPVISATGINGTPAISFGGTLTATAISTAGTIAGSICMTSGNLFLYESGATGCTISLEELKHDIAPLGVRTGEFMALGPISFGYNDPTMPQKRLGFGAHQVFGVDPALSTFDSNGKLQAYDPNGVLALTVAVVQRQVWEIRALAVVCVLLVLWCAGLTTAMMRTGCR